MLPSANRFDWWKPVLFALLALAIHSHAIAQDRLQTLPGYERVRALRDKAANSIGTGSVRVAWLDGGKAFEFRKYGHLYRYEIDERTLLDLGPQGSRSTAAPGRGPRPTGSRLAPRPARGRQYEWAISPDGKLKAFYRDHNIWLSAPDGSAAKPLTREGNRQSRLKFGTASWVYGEELEQNTAIWWSPDSGKVGFYRFDESRVEDYWLQMQQTRVVSTADVEPYVKAGATNPVVDILIYDVKSGQTVWADARGGAPFSDEVVGHYLYGVQWSPDGRELMFRRTDRRQKIMEFVACDPATGKCRVIVREEWPPSWTENSPAMEFLKDGRRFVWASERTGWRNLYLYDLQTGLLNRLTTHDFEVNRLARVDEEHGVIFYTAHDGDNPLKIQLHRVRLDGSGHQRLTDPAFHHSVDVAPDGRHFIDVAETHDQPPRTILRDSEGGALEELAAGDLDRFRALGLRTVELLRFPAADGQTELFGMLHFPSTFIRGRKYPLLVSVYAGPATTGARETFTLPSSLTEYGFLVASFDSRSASGRGKRFLDAIYAKLGRVEIDDQAAGVRYLAARRYVDTNRVGIFGTSYGGFASAMALVRYPRLFHAACASAAVTDYRNYDSIYTERYMGLPQDHPAAYAATSISNYATNLQGRLMIYYGTADDNVHPNNTMQLIQALQKAGKSFEVQVGPDRGHESLSQERMMEFFIEHLLSQKRSP